MNMTGTKTPDAAFDSLAERFAGLSVDEGRKLYASLTPAEQAAMDDRGLKRSWRSMRAAETRGRRVNAEMQKALDDAGAKKGGA
jgi:hypothetical protein